VAKKKQGFTDPRARRLANSAGVTLGVAPVPACFLGSFLVGSGGRMTTAAWVLLATVAVLACAAATNLFVAPRVEAEALRIWALREQEWAEQLAARSAKPPAPPGPAPIGVPPLPVAPAPAAAPVPTTTAPVPVAPAADPVPALAVLSAAPVAAPAPVPAQ
jgi:hypothetical protein